MADGDSRSQPASLWVVAAASSFAAGTGVTWSSGAIGRSGATVATAKANIDARLSVTTSGADVININLGANNIRNGGSSMDEASVKSDYRYILNAHHAKWPNAQVYISKPWRRTYETNANTFAGWVDDLIAEEATWRKLGDDERDWLDGGDDGATYTYDLDCHYNDLGDAKKIEKLLDAMGY